MADPPRAPGQPPPLPPPFRDLTQEERAADTERVGFPAGRWGVIPPPPLPPAAPPVSLVPASVRTRSRAYLAALFTGKFVLAPLVLLVLGRFAQRRWPEYSDLLDFLLQFLPLPQ